MDFTPLRISTVKPLRDLNFDLYIYFKEQFLCYAKRGEQLSEDKFQKLKVQKIAKFFITESDEANYQSFLDALLQETITSATASIEEKVNMAEGAASSAVERMSSNPNESAYRATEKAAKSMRQVILGNPDALKKIFGKKVDKNEDIIKHSLNVCALSVKLAEVKKLSEKEQDDIGTAALIHDIGITKMHKNDLELFYKPKKLFNNDDKRVYYLHTRDAAELLKDKPFVTPAILELIFNHEEVLSGQGPNKKKKLTLSEEILSLVNNYDKRLIANKVPPAQALKDMMIDELGNYNLDLLNDFKKVLHSEGMLE
jgi:HD-GYP domain-containing protein (c-di-GMP phosphodiesterase class II)